ncbi:PREDICTED: uncharacterized protein LOC104739630 [Camelina sativa]|uniref:Uncharacterized protein LOC104739630 n=1 Tax=Camelina sativa TaxID=90675 RepID=A0ABM0VMB4_CAMSA|nr:PREDICTED: uncharacterized protein LOC104739630 [Camelina sativa]
MNREEEEECRRNQEAFKRFFEHIPRTAMMAVLSYFLHGTVSNYERDPSKPFSTALAYPAVGYVLFQVAHAFARAANYPHESLVHLDLLSILCGFAVAFIAFAAFIHDY